MLNFHWLPVKFCNLLVDYASDEINFQFSTSLAKSRLRSVYSDAHGLAYFLESRHIGHGLSALYQQSIEDMLFGTPLAKIKDATDKSTIQRCEEFTQLFIYVTTQESKNKGWFNMLHTKRESS